MASQSVRARWQLIKPINHALVSVSIAMLLITGPGYIIHSLLRRRRRRNIVDPVDDELLLRHS